MSFCYILYNSTVDKFYVGSTRDLESRLKEHLKPSHKSKYTRKQPGEWKLVHSMSFDNYSDAKRKELEIKRMKSRQYIEKLINMGL